MSVIGGIIPAGFRALPLSLTQLSLAAVLQCGQSFRWTIYPLFAPGVEILPDQTLPTHEYRLCLRDRVVCLRQSSEALFYRSMLPGPPLKPKEEDAMEAETLAWIHDYFQLDVDLVSLYEQWSKRDPVFQGIEKRFAGIRMLRQDPFENLVSFICSSNNNISRITKMVKALCKHYSPPFMTIPTPSLIPISANTEIESSQELSSETYHPFPPPPVLASPDVSATLRSLGFGYRAEFIQKTAKMLVDTHGSIKLGVNGLEPAEEWLKTLRQLSTNEAREELLKFVGVGRKVADCILLMSLDKHEVIPVDTHVHQIATKYYGLRAVSKTKSNMTPQLYNEVNDKLARVWGSYAGWAHSVLFTSDLKSFSSYGLPTPTSTPSPGASNKSSRSQSISNATLVTPSPSPSPRKRRRPTEAKANGTVVPIIKLEATSESSVAEIDLLSGEKGVGNISMVDRVKRRRRGVHTTS